MSTLFRSVCIAANKGIGYEIARLLAEAGMTVVVTSRTEDLGQAALKKLSELPSKCKPSPGVHSHRTQAALGVAKQAPRSQVRPVLHGMAHDQKLN
jgi:NAD(P)-dependent dehydrogenase (short-subunit alcohol dehydrogenase family)